MTTDCGALAPPPALFSLVIELHLVCLVADVAPHEESIVRGHAIDPPLSERRRVPGHPAFSEVAWQREEAASCSLPSCSNVTMLMPTAWTVPGSKCPSGRGAQG